MALATVPRVKANKPAKSKYNEVVAMVTEEQYNFRSAHGNDLIKGVHQEWSRVCAGSLPSICNNPHSPILAVCK